MSAFASLRTANAAAAISAVVPAAKFTAPFTVASTIAIPSAAAVFASALAIMAPFGRRLPDIESGERC